jgi:IclR family pca regulon transcriptional regulator
VVAAANVSVQASRTSIEVMRRRLLPPLLAATARIDADLRITAPRRGAL